MNPKNKEKLKQVLINILVEGLPIKNKGQGHRTAMYSLPEYTVNAHYNGSTIRLYFLPDFLGSLQYQIEETAYQRRYKILIEFNSTSMEDVAILTRKPKQKLHWLRNFYQPEEKYIVKTIESVALEVCPTISIEK